MMNNQKQWLLFQRGRQYFALAADNLVCQLSTFACAVLPDAPAGMVGLFSYAGEALPMLDMAACNGELADAAGNCLVISIDAQRQLGLLSDNVAELTDTPPEALSEGNLYTILTPATLQHLVSGATQA